MIPEQQIGGHQGGILSVQTMQHDVIAGTRLVLLFDKMETESCKEISAKKAHEELIAFREPKTIKRIH